MPPSINDTDGNAARCQAFFVQKIAFVLTKFNSVESTLDNLTMLCCRNISDLAIVTAAVYTPCPGKKEASSFSTISRAVLDRFS